MTNTKKPAFVYKRKQGEGKNVERLQFTVTFTLNDMTGEPNTRDILQEFSEDIADGIEERFEENYDELTVSGLTVKIERT